MDERRSELLQQPPQRPTVRGYPQQLAYGDQPPETPVLNVPGMRERRHGCTVNSRTGSLEEFRGGSSRNQDVRLPFVAEGADQESEALCRAARLRTVVNEEDAVAAHGPFTCCGSSPWRSAHR